MSFHFATSVKILKLFFFSRETLLTYVFLVPPVLHAVGAVEEAAVGGVALQVTPQKGAVPLGTPLVGAGAPATSTPGTPEVAQIERNCVI